MKFTARAALIFVTAAIASIIVTAYLSNSGGVVTTAENTGREMPGTKNPRELDA